MKKMLKPVLLLLASLFVSSALAGRLGAPLPALKIDNKGEIVLQGDGQAGYRAWDSTRLDTRGRVSIVHYLAARREAEKETRLFLERLKKAGLPRDLYLLTSIVNVDDVTFGMSSMAVSEMEKTKRQDPATALVIDYAGQGQKTWGVPARHSALFVLGADGKVIFAKEGGLNPEEVEQAMAAITREVSKRAKP
ncbi:YtfJ family protein [Solimonas sp. K1W22B-7]|uniref:YtfJ family protein n=1 Tax=Solimonas sp. K1W22B-7 TaxID=2303331 RepID=UPI0013C52E81|nr:YtfJ family protein [Solimonas sp. K1W22B-7]